MITEAHFAAPEEIMALLDGELLPERAQSVSIHLDECAECREFAEVLRKGSQTVSNWTVPAALPNADFEKRLVDAAGRIPVQGRFPGLNHWHHWRVFLRRRWLITATAAALVLAVAVTSRRAAAPSNMPVDMAQTDRGGATFGGLSHLPLPARSLERESSRSGGKLAVSEQSENLDQPAAGQLGLEKKGLASPYDRFSRAEVLQAPMIARTVTLSIVAKDFGFSRTALDAILARHHGYAASLNANTRQNAARSLEASLRIPAGELTEAVAELKSLGQVENEAQGGEEVTQQHADLVARLKNSRETEQRLQAILLQRTGKVSDILAVEQEIARVRGEIEQMEGEQKSLEHRVDFATIDLNLAEEYKAKIGSASPSISTRFHNAVIVGYRGAVESAIGVVLFVAEDGPVTVVWLAILAPMVWFLRRRWIRTTSATL